MVEDKKGLNVLSLFDGMSCGRIALERAGIEVENYYASEIDKYAIQVSKKNYPDIQHIGDVTKVRIPKGQHIDLLIAGSPCQGFSFAGKQLNFEDPRSKLFFEFVRLLKEARRYNPDIKFLLENVKMQKKFEEIITNEIGVNPININSSLFCAQNRERIYWTNIKINDIPKSNTLTFRNIMRENERPAILEYNSKTKKGISRIDHLEQVYSFDKNKPKNKVILCAELNGDTPSGKSRQSDRIYSIDGKHPCLTSSGASRSITDRGSSKKEDWGYTTIVECEHLQTLPDNYTAGVSSTQRYKMIGNGWTVDVISHIFKGLK